jgi:hypothetical protein
VPNPEILRDPSRLLEPGCPAECPSGAGLLLYGTTLASNKGDVTEIPQDWWCVVHSVQDVTAHNNPDIKAA